MDVGTWSGALKLFLESVGHSSAHPDQPSSEIVGSHKQVTDKLIDLRLHRQGDGIGPQRLEQISVSCFTFGELAFKIITPIKPSLMPNGTHLSPPNDSIASIFIDIVMLLALTNSEAS
jgi:hypothetical protein